MSRLITGVPVPTPVGQGGTGQTSYTNSEILVGQTTGNTLAKKTMSGDITIDENAVSAIGAAKVLTAMLATSSGTTPKIKPTSINSGFSTQGGNFTTTSTSYVDVTNMTFNYTPGSTNELLFLWLQCSFGNSGTNNTFVTLNIAGADLATALFSNASTTATPSRLFMYPIAGGAGATTIKMRCKTAAGTATVFTNTAEIIPEVRGFAISNV